MLVSEMLAGGFGRWRIDVAHPVIFEWIAAKVATKECHAGPYRTQFEIMIVAMPVSS